MAGVPLHPLASRGLDIEQMGKAELRSLGAHDFRNFFSAKADGKRGAEAGDL